MSDLDNAVVAAMIKAKEIGVKMLASDCDAILQAAIASMQEDVFDLAAGLNTVADMGFWPQVIYDDNGNWAIWDEGSANMRLDDDQDYQCSFLIPAEYFKPSLQEAWSCYVEKLKELGNDVSKLSTHAPDSAARIAELEQQLEVARKETAAALWLLMSRDVNRYLISNTKGREDGAEKAMTHMYLCCKYLATKFNLPETDQFAVRYNHEDEYQSVHSATQELTDNMDDAIGFPLDDNRPDYETLAPLFFTRFIQLADAAIRQIGGAE